MASDIQAVADSANPPDALIVTIPSTAIYTAIQNAVAAGVPVFGCNSGYDVAKSLGLSGFVGTCRPAPLECRACVRLLLTLFRCASCPFAVAPGMHEYQGGIFGANYFLEDKPSLAKAACVIHEVGNSALDARCRGFNDTLAPLGIDVNIVQVTMGDVPLLVSDLTSELGDCSYDVVLAGGAAVAPYIMDVFTCEWSCACCILLHR